MAHTGPLLPRTDCCVLMRPPCHARSDPNGAMLAFADMMRKKIVMPAHLMDDGEHRAKNGRHGWSWFPLRSVLYS